MRVGDAVLLKSFGLRVCDDCGAPYCRECGAHTKEVDSLLQAVDWDGPGWLCDCGWAVQQPECSEGWRW